MNVLNGLNWLKDWNVWIDLKVLKGWKGSLTGLIGLKGLNVLKGLKGLNVLKGLKGVLYGF